MPCWLINRILRRRLSLPRYLVRILILQATGIHFIHVRPDSEGGNVSYNLDDRPVNPSSNELTRHIPLRDGTHIIFSFDPDDSSHSDESSLFGIPPSFDSDGNEYRDSPSVASSGGPPSTETSTVTDDDDNDNNDDDADVASL